MAILRPAATVVLMRGAPGDGFEVLLVKRNDTVAFMAGNYVFPGGRVDDDDRVTADALGRPGGAASRFPDLTFAEELSYRVAGVREMEEEASVRLTADALVPFAHWVTPNIETRRYDTRFFLAELPDRQEARHDNSEMTDLVWATPLDAVDRCRRGDIMLPPPTWTTLRQLARFDSADAAFDWARGKPIVRIQPELFSDGDRKVLTLPGDPRHPTIEGWDVPEDTRFVLEEGRGWQPVRA